MFRKGRQALFVAVYTLTLIYLIQSLYNGNQLQPSQKSSSSSQQSLFDNAFYNHNTKPLSPYVRNDEPVGNLSFVPTGDFVPKLEPYVKYDKYFHEAPDMPHLDSRYALNKTSSMKTLEDLFAAWHKFSITNEVKYWLAHGTLLGWYFGGEVMPWDDDIDIQIPIKHLYTLRGFNTTLVDNRYLLDVNPAYKFRFHEKDNVIDARFIDTYTGSFIDITALSFSGYDGKNALVSCKSPHSYNLQELMPLRDTVFGGHKVLVSNDWRGHIVQEYGEKGLSTRYKDYVFIENL